MPCTDGILFIESTCSSELEHKHHDHSHDTNDTCTPFCTCACCGSIIAMPHIYQLPQSKIELSSSYQFHYAFDYFFDYNEGVWHPPTNS
jgi:hypothetical protein